MATLNYQRVVVRRERSRAQGIHIPYMFPIQWGAVRSWEFRNHLIGYDHDSPNAMNNCHQLQLSPAPAHGLKKNCCLRLNGWGCFMAAIRGDIGGGL